MPLKVRIKPEGKFFVHGSGWLKNGGARPMDIIVSEGLMVQREQMVKRSVDKLRPHQQ